MAELYIGDNRGLFFWCIIKIAKDSYNFTNRVRLDELSTAILSTTLAKEQFVASTLTERNDLVYKW